MSSSSFEFDCDCDFDCRAADPIGGAFDARNFLVVVVEGDPPVVDPAGFCTAGDKDGCNGGPGGEEENEEARVVGLDDEGGLGTLRDPGLVALDGLSPNICNSLSVTGALRTRSVAGTLLGLGGEVDGPGSVVADDERFEGEAVGGGGGCGDC